MSRTKHLNPVLKLALEVGPLVIFFMANAYSDRFGVPQERRIFARVHLLFKLDTTGVP